MPPVTQPRLAPSGAQKSALDRALSIVTDVHAGEGAGALLLAINIFFLLAFYSVLKIIRDSLILSEGSAELGSYSAAGQALILLAVVPAYGAFASRVDRVRLICGVSLFFAANLLVFWALGVSGVRIGIPFYLWAGVFNVIVIAQLWAFANDLYTKDRGKRLFPLVNLGANLGAFLGALGTTLAFSGAGPFPLMIVSAAGLSASIVLTLMINRRERAGGRDAAGEQAGEPLGRSGGFQLVLANRYLLLIALLIIVLNMVNTLGGFLLNTLIRAEALATFVPGAAPDATLTELQLEEVRAAVGTMSGSVQTWVNFVTLLSGLFIASRVLQWIGVRGALYVLPCVALASYSIIAFVPIFSIVRLAKILENSTDYSVQNVARHALFLPTSREAKYKAKQAIDTFFWRAGDLLQAGVVLIGSSLGFNVTTYALVNVVLVLIWLGIVTAIAREHRKLVPVEREAQAA
jgi:AAA family ATP:ADP antiporter